MPKPFFVYNSYTTILEGVIQMKPTIKKIAENLGLSQATVSKALSGRQDISEDTRNRVRDYADEVGYFKTVNIKRRISILTINPEEMDSGQPTLMFNMIMGFQRYANKLQYDVVISNMNSEEQNKETIDQFAIKNQFDGLFIMGLGKKDSFYEQLKSTKTPVVLLDINTQNPLVGNVSTDSLYGGLLAIEHLYQLGHKNIGFVNGHKNAYISHERFAGYLAGINAYGLPYNQDFYFDGDYTMESGATAADYFIKTNVSAIYFASDLMAFGAIRRFQALGFSIPDDYSIIGFDNQPLCLGSTPPLTSIAQNPLLIGETACALIHGIMNDNPISHVKLEPLLVVRGSTASI